MSDPGSRVKRHIAVRYPKSWRRKRRKAAGTTEVVTTYQEDCPSTPVHLNVPSDARDATTPRADPQGFSSIEVRENTASNVLNNADDDFSDSSTDTDIHELHEVGETDVNMFNGHLSEESEDDDREILTRGQILPSTRKVENMMLRRHVISALCLVIGSSRLTAKQYKLSRALANHEGKYRKREGYPCYSTLCANVLPVMRRFVYVPTILKQMSINSNLAGAPQPTCSETGEMVPVSTKVKIILPSSWAKKDVNTISYFSSDPSAGLDTQRRCPSIWHINMENTAIARHPLLCLRANVLKSVSLYGNVWVSDNNVYDALQIEVTLHLPPQRSRAIFTSLGAAFRSESGHQTLILRANVLSTYIQEVREDNLSPGDVVSFLQISDCPSHIKVLLVHRMKRQMRHPVQSVQIRNGNGDNETVVAKCKRISSLASAVNNLEHPISYPHVHTYGKLADGRLYSVYKVILYSDDFEQFSNKKGSAGGCYILPVGLPLQHRRGLGSVRVVTLTPPGISTNKAILSIIPDIITSTTHGIESTDFFGVRRTIFIEVIAYIGDYQAVRHVLDVTGPRGIAPCPLCTFPKGSLVGSKNSEYAYSVTSHSGHASFRRDKRRMLLLRRNVNKAAELQELGLQDISLGQVSNLPLHALSDALEKIRDVIPKTEDGKPVVSGLLDPYLSTLVAPDHLFSGLGEDLINANMRILPKPRRLIAETLMQHALFSNGLATEPHLYNHGKLHLHSMSISTMFNLILVAPWSLYQCNYYDSKGKRTKLQHPPITGCLELLFRYQELVSDTMFLPNCDVDGKHTVMDYNDTEDHSRLGYLKRKCAEYIQAVDSVCGVNNLAKKELDKPNVHRLLELFNHTIPLLGHVRQFQELLFEAAHQPLKRGLKQSNYRDPQLTAIDTMLANDWKSRVGQTLHDFGAKDIEELTSNEYVKLNRVLCGDVNNENVTGREEEIAARIKECFKPPVTEHFLSVVREREGMRARQWIPFWYKDKEKETFKYSPVTDTISAMRYLRELNRYQIENGGVIRSVMYAKSVRKQARSESISAVKGKQPKSSIHVIRRFDVIQAAVQTVRDTLEANLGEVRMLQIQEEYVNCNTAPSCTRSFGVVLDIISLSTRSHKDDESLATESMFAVVWPIALNNRVKVPIAKFYKVYSVTKRDSLFVIPLKPSVRKVMALHLCNWNKEARCDVIPCSQSCSHNGSIVGDEPFLLFGTLEGFPPRDG